MTASLPVTEPLRAIVRRVLPNEMFLVETDHGDMLRVHVSGKLRNAFIRLLPGDTVRVEPSPFDATKGRLVMPSRAVGPQTKTADSELAEQENNQPE